MAARTTLLYTLLLAIVLGLGGCKKDELAMEAATELHQLANEIAAKVQEGDDRKAGVEAAQKLLDERRPALQAKMSEVVLMTREDISEQTAAQVNKARADASLVVVGVSLGLVREAAMDPELGTKLTKLTDDFTKLSDGE